MSAQVQVVLVVTVNAKEFDKGELSDGVPKTEIGRQLGRNEVYSSSFLKRWYLKSRSIRRT